LLFFQKKLSLGSIVLAMASRIGFCNGLGAQRISSDILVGEEDMKEQLRHAPKPPNSLLLKFFAALMTLFVIGSPNPAEAQHSVARQWSEALLQSIRKDLARPPVHARNLFHFSVAVYDAWAAYDNVAETYLLGKTVNGYTCPFNGIGVPADVQAAREEAISYAAYRLLRHRFKNSPNAATTLARLDSVLAALGYNAANTSTDYSNGSAAALGNYIAQSLIDFGLQDGSNEQGNYAYLNYKPFNPPLIVDFSGNPDCIDPNRWQPLTLEVFIDQAGNIIPGNTPKFVCPEWGHVSPFALTAADRTIYERDGFEYPVYHDPGSPPLLDTTKVGGLSEEYKWSYALVSIWQSHHDPTDGVMWDISPASIGNVQQLPKTFAEHRNFYNLLDGGDTGEGYDINPRTGQPYVPQIVPRGDYTRALTEFWADGPASETPPGHWFTILNYVSEHPSFKKRFKGQEPILDDLEWDVKAYFTLGGAMHDAAITAWGIKGWYDSIRPISALRFMADKGQSTDPNLPRYSPAGISLIPGYIEMVQAGDALAGENGENINKIKLYTWRGHAFIDDPETDIAGAGWILAEDWITYQLKTFVTPPFAGYISGHSTYSRTAAEVMTLITGDEFFPDGLGEFSCPKNEFLEVEEGPSVDVTLQWATYRDASDQTSLSRIWGGIHPPLDDIPGRLIGQEIGPSAVALAERYFSGQATGVEQKPSAGSAPSNYVYVHPNPIKSGNVLNIEMNPSFADVVVQLYNLRGQLVHSQAAPAQPNQRRLIALDTNFMPAGVYFVRVHGSHRTATRKILILK
jgi:hypothetical protein